MSSKTASILSYTPICMKMEMAIKSGSQREGGVVVFIGKRGESGRSL